MISIKLAQRHRGAEMDENTIGTLIVETAIEIHKSLGPGLLESVYEQILAYELKSKGLQIQTQIPISVHYKSLKIENAFRADLIAENKVIIEIKSVESLNKAHSKQLLTYLKLTNHKLGYLLNFGEPLMKNGIQRIANNL